MNSPQVLTPPPVTDDAPGPGKRIRQWQSEYAGSGVYHSLYLPSDWQPGGQYPLIVEYAGNCYGASAGTVEGSCLGYGITGGQQFIWVCLPFVDVIHKTNSLTWWGDVQATLDYCLKTVRRVCTVYGGDARSIFLAGFSRGAIACNFIGLHNDEIAALWKGFICHSHYDGVRLWPYAGSERDAAAERLKRLGERPQWISHEETTDDSVCLAATRRYLQEARPGGSFTFRQMLFKEHTDTWVLRDSLERQALRAWLLNNL